ncbi:hypothetical protein Cob_v011441 [Colletotrichum orbiculare MAFF 240422]|uniref:DUF6536 domain-containing protein n=1 Tax=Colletotrichum orbiculare (strain 104-T / ATCC 96160 / CBS 514.97 / LARS 414 / MAFF 240422) TaxID=1213857 RepID=A0A484FDP8_COLOR|nr:hypothetical protein Cob_v011441 [Colletotrichum orbiculare MAFF 240422]
MLGILLVSVVKRGTFAQAWTAHEADCRTGHAAVANTLVHFLLNALSSAILATSNFFMQVLNESSIQGVRKAHAREKWLADMICGCGRPEGNWTLNSASGNSSDAGFLRPNLYAHASLPMSHCLVQSRTTVCAVGLSKPPLLAVMSTVAKFISSVVTVNISQIYLSLWYLAYNSLLTRLDLAREWAQLYTHYRPVRVTRPGGTQNSTHRLQLPYRYSIALLLLGILMHWLTSRALLSQYTREVGTFTITASGGLRGRLHRSP